jgi:hypothetical protein
MNSSRIFEIIAEDGLYNIISFLPIGSTLMLAMTCKSLHDTIKIIVHNINPLAQPWSITKALRTRVVFRVNTKKKVQELKGLLKNDSLNDLTDMVKVCSIFGRMDVRRTNRDTNIEDYQKIFGVKKKNTVKTETLTVPIKPGKVSLFKDRLTPLARKMQTINECLGFKIRHLILGTPLALDDNDIVKILSSTMNLESLRLELTGISNTWYEKHLRGANQEDSIAVPILNNLKKLHMSNFNQGNGDSIINTLLQLAPNLEDFKYIYQYTLKNEFLEYINKNNTKLKKVHISGCYSVIEDGGTTQFTDQGILDFISKYELEELVLYHNRAITGTLFARIGKYGANLKKLFIQRIDYRTIDHVQCEKIVLGGGVMNRLKSFGIAGNWKDLRQDFVDSVVKYAPNIAHLNLQGINELYDSGCISYNYDGLPAEYMAQLVSHFKLKTIILPSLDKNEATKLAAALSQQHSLVTIESHWNIVDNVTFSTEQLDHYYFPNVKKLRVYGNMDKGWFTVLEKAFPDLIELEIQYNFDEQALVELLRDTAKWKNLIKIDLNLYGGMITDNSQISDVRPYLSLNNLTSFSGVEPEATTKEDFIRQWLDGDWPFSYRWDLL